MSEFAIEVSNLSKLYHIGHVDGKVLGPRERITKALTAPFRRIKGLLSGHISATTELYEPLWAIKDLSFKVKRGEVLGVIGKNGAGKSTLLKILSRVVAPTTGRAIMRGRVGSLLEVGTGFQPDLTGRENVFLNGTMLGLRRKEIHRKFDAIVEFSEIGKFIDTPVKHYSSGMYTRLAFAVAAHLEPEVMIVDEVLAVGDVGFQMKCLGKMNDVAKAGRTVLFVSHNMTAVQRLCDEVLLLKGGQMTFMGATEDGVGAYVNDLGRQGDVVNDSNVYDLSQRENRLTPGQVMLQRASLLNEKGEPARFIQMGRPCSVVVEVQGLQDIRAPQVGIIIKSNTDQWLSMVNTGMQPPAVTPGCANRERLTYRIPRMPLMPGSYWIDVSVARKSIGRIDYVEHAVPFDVMEADVYGSGYQMKPQDGVFFMTGEWCVESMEASQARERVA